MLETPRFIQGVYSFEGLGLEQPVPLHPAVGYTVPRDKRAQLIYLRAGNSTSELVYLLLKATATPMRYFPIGARDDPRAARDRGGHPPGERARAVRRARPRARAGSRRSIIGLAEI